MSSSRERPELPPGPYGVVGLARSGIAAAELLQRLGHEVVATDSGSPDAAAGLRDLGVEVHLDGDGVELLTRVKTLVKSPGVPANAAIVAGARERGIDVLGELELAWRLLPNRFVAVTGTNGKTTVVEWLGHVLRRAGVEAVVAGNVGTALSSQVGSIPAEAVVIAECSSFQLEDSVAFRPEVAVLLNLTPDHLDRHGTIEGYLEAKLMIFRNQAGDDVSAFDLDQRRRVGFEIPGSGRQVAYGIGACEEASANCAVWLEGGALRTDAGAVVEAAELALAGEHNLRNAMAVVAAATALGLVPAEIAPGMCDFPGVRHRLERIAVRDGVSFVNDSKATNVAATDAAIRSFAGGVRVILGGSLKGGGFGELRGALEERATGAYLIGEAAAVLRADLEGSTELHDCPDLARAVAGAAADAEPEETVLLAPACASFDAFRDYEHRGQCFRELVEGLG